MQLSSGSPLLFPLLLVASIPAVAIAESGHGHHNHPHPSRSDSGSVFPLLSWLRDSAVRLVYGAHTEKDTSYSRPTGADIARKFQDEIVIRFNVTTAEEERALAKATETLFLDIWSWDNTIDLRIQRNMVAPLKTLLPESLHSSYWVLVDDLPSAVYASYLPPATSSKELHQTERKFSVDLTRVPGDGDESLYFFHNYQPHKVVMRWMRLVEAMFPSFVRFSVIGQTYEGRDIPALIVGAQDRERDPDKPRKTLVVMGGSHAREWISTTTVNYLAWSFITAYGKDRLITRFLQAYDIVFIPELNPDGIEYTWNTDRLWRKSRQHTNIMVCRGLDLDHAFGYEWDSWRRSSHQNDPCSESYAGSEPWESVEVAAFRDWASREARDNGVDFVGLVDLHSYSQQILFPYAYTCDVEPPNLEKMEELALGLAKSIRLFSGETYSVKPACQGATASTKAMYVRALHDYEDDDRTVLSFHKDDVIQVITQLESGWWDGEINGIRGWFPSNYCEIINETTSGGGAGMRIEPSGGSAIDWFYHELRAHYSYQIKLRDTGSYGFLLPPEEIIPTGEEILQALKYLGDFMLGNDGIENLRADEGAESDHQLFAVPEEYEEVLELKRRRVKR